MSSNIKVLSKGKFVYRIRNEDTGDYLNGRLYYYDSMIKEISEKAVKTEWDLRILEQTSTEFKYKPSERSPYTYYLTFNNHGKLYPTKRGAEALCSEMTKCTYRDRETPAGMILKAKFNLKVVKTRVDLTDVPFEADELSKPKRKKKSV